MTEVSPSLSVIILNVSGLNYPIKGHRMAKNVKKKKKTQIQAAFKHSLQLIHRLKMKIWKKTFHENGNQKRGQS